MRQIKSLLFDMAGTLADIPIGDNWDKVTYDGISLVNKIIGLNNILNDKELYEVSSEFVESKRILRKKAKSTLQEFPIDIQLKNYLIHILGEKEKLKTFINNLNINSELLSKMDEAFIQTELDIIIPFNNLNSTLKNLSEKYDLYLLSNNVSTILVIEILKKLNVTKYFKQIIVSKDIGYRKPHKLFLDYVIDKTNISVNSSVMIGDRLTQDIKMADDFGMQSVFVTIADHEDNNNASGINYTYKIDDLKELNKIFLL